MTRWLESYTEMKDFYEKHGHGELCSFGKTPAIAVIDFGLAWIDKKSSKF